MSALRKHQVEGLPQTEAEVIYLVIPPTAVVDTKPAFKPYTVAERWGLLVEEVQLRWHRMSNACLSMGIAVGLVALVGYSAYMTKSAMGINLFSVQRLESFVPIPGFGR
jgi:hypothetical protein